MPTKVRIYLNLGLVWFILPSLLVISNDIFAYIFGISFGKTPLIELSPKKTWEGFIGGSLSTLFFAFLVLISINISLQMCSRTLVRLHALNMNSWSCLSSKLFVTFPQCLLSKPIKLSWDLFHSHHSKFTPWYWAYSLVLLPLLEDSLLQVSREP